MYTGPLTNYMTPDGRAVTFPADFAAQFPGLSPAPLAGTDIPAGGAPQWSPSDSAALAQQTPPQPLPDASAAPVTSPEQVPNGGPPAQPVPGPVTQPGPNEPPQPVAPAPPPAPLRTQADVDRARGEAFGESGRALDAEKAAIQRSAQVEADTATMQGQRMADQAAETQRILEERAKAAAENQAELNRRITARDALSEKVANTRVDRSIDNFILAAIGIALGTVGGAMQAKQTGTAFQNTAFDTLMKGIDWKVQAQMADLDRQRQRLADMGVGITEQRQAGMDRLAEIDVRRDAALAQAKLDLDRMATQMKAPAAIAKAQELGTKIDQTRGELKNKYATEQQAQINAEAQRKQAAQFHADTIGMQRIQLEHEDMRFLAAQEQQEKLHMADVAGRLLKEGKAEAAAKVKMAGEQGLRDPSTGKLMLTQAGTSKMAQADAMEAKARAATDPADAQKLNTQASLLRDSAYANDVAMAGDKKQAEDAQHVVNIAQDTANNTAIATRLLQSDPSPANREKWAEIQVSLEGVKTNYAQAMGERMSPKALEAVDTILSIDPDSLYSRTVDQGKALAALKVLNQQVAGRADVHLKGAGIVTSWTPGRTEERVSFSGRTAQEEANAAEPGALRGDLRGLAAKASGLPNEPAQEAALNAALDRRSKPSKAFPEGRTSNYGLDPDVDEAVRALVSRSSKVGHAAYADIVQQLAVPLAETNRPGLDVGVGRLLLDEDPKLYRDTMAAVAASAGQQRAAELDAAVKPPDLTPRPPRPSSSPEPPPVVPLTPLMTDYAGKSYPGSAPPVFRYLTPEQQQRLTDYARGIR